MRSTKIIITGLFAMILLCFSGSSAFAEVTSRPPITNPQEAGTFGSFEVGLPGIPEGQTIDDFVADSKPILKFINFAVNAVIAVLVIIGLITIVIGGYIYMTAAGDGSKVKVAKEMIIAALAGIFLSLVSVIILNTINSYLGTDAEEPKLGEPSGGTSGGSGGGGSGCGGGGSGNNANNGGGGGGNFAPTLAQLEAEREDNLSTIALMRARLAQPGNSATSIAEYNSVIADRERAIERIDAAISNLNQ